MYEEDHEFKTPRGTSGRLSPLATGSTQQSTCHRDLQQNVTAGIMGPSLYMTKAEALPYMWLFAYHKHPLWYLEAFTVETNET